MKLTFLNSLNFIKSDLKYRKLKNMKETDYSQFLMLEYKKRTGKILNFSNLKTYNEKMQSYKLKNSSALKTKLSDKFQVRDWISETIGSEYLIPLLGVYEDYSDIDFGSLPDKFVLKTNHDSGTNLIVKDKKKINHFKERIKFIRSLNRNFAFKGDLQPHYKNIPPKIIAEKYIEDSDNELKEYKFFCFDGEVYYCWFILEMGTERYGNVYDLDWNLQPWIFSGRENTLHDIERPNNLEKMIKIATELSKGFSHVRVDLYNVDGKIYFGEMTFTSTGGYRLIEPEKYDYKLGELWDLK